MTISIKRIYKTKAYDELEAFCGDDKGGDSMFLMGDIFNRQQVVNLLLPIIEKEAKEEEKANWKKEKEYLEHLLHLAEESSWDLEDFLIELKDTKDTPKGMVEWFVKRWNLKKGG